MASAPHTLHPLHLAIPRRANFIIYNEDIRNLVIAFGEYDEGEPRFARSFVNCSTCVSVYAMLASKLNRLNGRGGCIAWLQQEQFLAAL